MRAFQFLVAFLKVHIHLYAFRSLLTALAQYTRLLDFQGQLTDQSVYHWQGRWFFLCVLFLYQRLMRENCMAVPYHRYTYMPTPTLTHMYIHTHTHTSPTPVPSLPFALFTPLVHPSDCDFDQSKTELLIWKQFVMVAWCSCHRARGGCVS